MTKKLIYTVGHSTHSTREFMKILKAHGITLLIDIRYYPHSKFCPQFNKALLKRNLTRHHIHYLSMPELGGRRKRDKNSNANVGWRSTAFRGYADYMQTSDFKIALKYLMALAKKYQCAIMCAEAVPWRCHRSLVADALSVHGFKVFDIFSETIIKPHRMTPFAVIHAKNITYPQPI